MQEKAIVYGVVAWLACWEIDLIIFSIRTPPQLDPMLKAIVVLICLVIILFGLSKARWLLK
jgi:hypothetical protein